MRGCPIRFFWEKWNMVGQFQLGIRRTRERPRKFEESRGASRDNCRTKEYRQMLKAARLHQMLQHRESIPMKIS